MNAANYSSRCSLLTQRPLPGLFCIVAENLLSIRAHYSCLAAMPADALGAPLGRCGVYVVGSGGSSVHHPDGNPK
jgi:hypothetical protein